MSDLTENEDEEAKRRRMLNGMLAAMSKRDVSANGFAALAGVTAFMGAILVFGSMSKWLTRIGLLAAGVLTASAPARDWVFAFLGLGK